MSANLADFRHKYSWVSLQHTDKLFCDCPPNLALCVATVPCKASNRLWACKAWGLKSDGCQVTAQGKCRQHHCHWSIARSIACCSGPDHAAIWCCFRSSTSSIGMWYMHSCNMPQNLESTGFRSTVQWPQVWGNEMKCSAVAVSRDCASTLACFKTNMYVAMLWYPTVKRLSVF